MIINYDDDYFSNIQQDMKFLINSEIRLKILACLYNSPISIKDLEKLVGFNYTSILDNINKLEEKGFIFNRNDEFYLYNKTKLKLVNILYFNKSSNFLEKHSNFFNDCEVDKNNINVLKDLSPLFESKLVESTKIDLFKAIEIFKDSLMGFKFLKGIFPYVHPGYQDIIKYWLENEVCVNLILPNEVFIVFKDFILDYMSKNDSIKNKYVKLKSVNKKINCAFVVSDKCLVLAFYNKYGKFNQNAVLTSTSSDAITWGLNLFEEYNNLCKDYSSLEDFIYPNSKGE